MSENNDELDQIKKGIGILSSKIDQLLHRVDAAHGEGMAGTLLLTNLLKILEREKIALASECFAGAESIVREKPFSPVGNVVERRLRELRRNVV